MRTVTLLVIAVSLMHGAVVLDRIAVIVGQKVIKTSDIDRDLRVTEFLNRDRLSLESKLKRQAAERLIDQEIIREEISTGGYRRPPDRDAEAVLTQLRHDRFGDSETRLKQSLAQYGLSEDQLRAQLLWQLTVLSYIDQRFRVGVLVTDDEVHTYYDQHLIELRKQYPQDPSFDALSPKIRESLEGQRVNEEFNRWLEEARKRSRIEYREKAFA